MVENQGKKLIDISQHVNTTDSAVRLTHIPTGIVVCMQDQRSQHQNKAQAFKVLAARLYEREKEIQNRQRAELRQTQIGTGDRSEKIRTYNFARGQITDHRIKHSEFGMDKMLQGDLLSNFTDELLFQRRLEQLHVAAAEKGDDEKQKSDGESKKPKGRKK